MTPHFKADGLKVMYDPTPDGIKNDDGSTTYSLIVPLVEVTEYLKAPERIAEKIANILNKHWED